MAALVEPMSMAAVAAGADGLIIEVHNNPAAALCDGAQSLRPESFDVLMKKILGFAPIWQVEYKGPHGDLTIQKRADSDFLNISESALFYTD